MRYLASLILLCLFPAALNAQAAASGVPPTIATITAPVATGDTELNDEIHLTVNGDTAMTCDDFQLFVNDRRGLVHCSPGSNEREFVFTLLRDDADKPQNNRVDWAAILGTAVSSTIPIRVIVAANAKPLELTFYAPPAKAPASQTWQQTRHLRHPTAESNHTSSARTGCPSKC